jgi:hypothetical protein
MAKYVLIKEEVNESSIFEHVAVGQISNPLSKCSATVEAEKKVSSRFCVDFLILAGCERLTHRTYQTERLAS